MQETLKLRRQHHVHEDRRKQERHHKARLHIFERLYTPRELCRITRLQLDGVQLALQYRDSITDTKTTFDVGDEGDLTLSGLSFDRRGTQILFQFCKIRELDLTN